MNTITAKELRDNLESVSKRVQKGEQFKVSYRSKIAMILSPPPVEISQYTGDKVGLRLDSIVKRLPESIGSKVKESNKTLKEIRVELYRRDPKYSKYLSSEDINE